MLQARSRELLAHSLAIRVCRRGLCGQTVAPSTLTPAAESRGRASASKRCGLSLKTCCNVHAVPSALCVVVVTCVGVHVMCLWEAHGYRLRQSVWRQVARSSVSPALAAQLFPVMQSQIDTPSCTFAIAWTPSATSSCVSRSTIRHLQHFGQTSASQGVLSCGLETTMRCYIEQL